MSFVFCFRPCFKSTYKMGDQPDQSTTNPINYASGQHFLAEIKYPNIPDVISIDKIFNVLQKIKTTSKPLFYKWQTIYRPQRKKISRAFFYNLLLFFRWRNILGTKISANEGPSGRRTISNCRRWISLVIHP